MISVIGLGYIGLPTAAAFASQKVKVIGVDVNEDIVSTINRGDVHIVEAELDTVVRTTVAEGYLRATTIAEKADVFIIAVPTPLGDLCEPDLSYVEAASKAISLLLRKGNLVILESTSPVGTTEKMAEWLADARPDLTFPQQAGEDSDIRIAYCPERVLPGKVLRELVENDRVIGGMTNSCSIAAASVYKIFVKGDCVLTNSRTAEMCKLAENAFRDINIAYANELSMICDRLGIDPWMLIKLANRHPRVNILQPGSGVGGHCIAVDPWFIVASAPEDARLIRAAREVNDEKPLWVLRKLYQAVDNFSTEHGGKRPIIALLGLAFKPDIDDLRESPAVYIARHLCVRHGKDLLVVEPHIKRLPDELSNSRLTTLEEALHGADILVVLVKHTSFQSLVHCDLSVNQLIIDAAGLLSGRERCH